MRIGQLSERSGVPVRTIRYYDEIGLLPAGGRTDSGYRIYGDEHLARLRFIRSARRLGFGLEQIRVILSAATGDSPPCNRVRPILQDNIGRIDARIAELVALRNTLERRLNYTPEGAYSVARSEEGICPLVENGSEVPGQKIDLDSPVDWNV
jgi:MerR family transcriptional regulator, copper efflux regulator